MDTSPPSLEIRLLGDFQITYDDAPVDGLSRPRCQALLAYLLLHREAEQSRRHLAFLLWPDSTEAQALTNLRHVLHDLQAGLPVSVPWLSVTPQTLRWNTGTPFVLDVATFERGTCAEGTPDELQMAIDAYCGDLLPACYDEWVLPERERLLQAYLAALERLAKVREAEGNYVIAIELARLLLSRDPLREASYRLLMRLHALNGDRSAAIRVYHSCTSVLQKELGVVPDPSTRRLYEQIMDLEVLAAAQLPFFLKLAADEDTRGELRRPVFVTRERELERLERSLDLALEGQGRVVFVTGDAGQGKTALVQEFARRALAAHSELVVASGDGNAYRGSGDPYAPFREILSLLTGDIEERWAAQSFSREQARRLWHTLPLTIQALVDAGPDLVDSFVPGPSLARRAAAYEPWPGRAQWLPQLQELVRHKTTLPARPDLNQTALFEQYCRVVRTVARLRPLLLTIDDMQWADAGSVSLLFHLGRSMAGSRVLVVGAYRSTDIAPGRDGERHPLESVVTEFKLEWGDSEVDLREADGERFVAAYLDTEPNRLGQSFRTTLFQQTAGLPLATVELLREMRARGGLVRDSEGYWTEGLTLDWSTLPVRVEAMIASRIGRLDEKARHVLQVASVEGETFTAEVVAAVVGTGEQEVARLLSQELDRSHHLVKAEGVRSVNGRQLSIYRFRHILFQKYLYTSLDAVERSRLHDGVGSALQTLYAAETSQIVVELARHFAASGGADQAAAFLNQAGDRAIVLAAYQEAADAYLAARDAYAAAYKESWDPLEQVVLERKIGEAFFHSGNYAQATKHLQRALGLLGASVADSRGQIRRALLAQMLRQVAHRLLPRTFRRPSASPVPRAVELKLELWYSLSLIDFLSSRQERHLLLVFKILNEAENCGLASWIARSCAGLTFPFDAMALGRLAQAYGVRAVDLAEQVQDAEALALAHEAAAHHALWVGQWAAALQHGEASLAALSADSASFQRGIAAWVVASALISQGKARQGLAVGEELVRTGEQRANLEMGLEGAGRAGLALLRLGRLGEALPALTRAVELADTIPDLLNRVQARGDLGKCLLGLGQSEASLAVLEEASRLAREHQVLPHNSAPVWAGLVEAYLRLAEQAPEIERPHWLKKARHASDTSLKNARRSQPARPEALRLRGAYEWLRGNHRRGQNCWQRSALLAEQMGMRYDLGLAHLEMGLRMQDRPHLERAEAILAEIDAALDAARARQALEQITTG